MFTENIFKNILTQRRGDRRELCVITKFFVPHMLFLIFIMKISMKEESGFLITYSPLRPLRLCVMISSRKAYITKSKDKF